MAGQSSLRLAETTTASKELTVGAELLTPRQRELNHLLAGPQRHTLFYGGARSGKTWLIVRAILLRAARYGGRHAMLRFRANAARASLWLDTLPKVARLCFPERVRLVDHRSEGFVEVQPSGAQIWIAGLDEKERVEKILGQEFVSIYLNESRRSPIRRCCWR
jgi:hypothetical protein